MLTIIGFILGIVWLIFLCVIAILSIIKVINKVKHKTESIRLQRIFTFLLKSIIPFFLVLFFVGGCSTMFADPKFYVYVYNNIFNLGTYVYDKSMYNEILSNKNIKGIELIQEENNFLNFKVHQNKFYYTDSKNNKYLVYKIVVFSYINYGLWLSGDEGAGFRWHFRESYGGFLKNDNKIFYFEE